MNLKIQNISFIILILKKEINSIHKSFVFYAVTLFFFLSAGIGFIGNDFWFNAKLSDFRLFFMNMPLLLCIIIPILTMNLWADEKKSGTDKLLFSFPISIRTIVYGKYLSLVSIWAIILLSTTIIPFSVFALGQFSIGSFIISYIAVFLFGAGLISISAALSTISRHSELNFLLSFLIVLFFTFIQNTVKNFALPNFMQNIINYISFKSHFESAARGILDSRDFMFYLILIALGIELHIFILNTQKENR